MRRATLALLCACCAGLVLFPQTAVAEDAITKSPNSPTSAELVESPKTWNGKTVTFTGEVIGEAMKRGDHAWIHINDDAYYKRNVEEGAALGGYNSGHAVWIPTELTEAIKYFGDYKHEGDIVTVTGVFNAACAQHGGDMDIHATALIVDTPGHHVTDAVRPWKIALAVALLAMALGLWWVNRRIAHREKHGLLGIG